MLDPCICGNDAVPGRLKDLETTCQLSFLKDSQVQIHMGHPSQRRLQSDVPAVTNILCSKMYRLPPLHIPPSTPVHPLPTNTFTYSSSANRPAHEGPSFSLFLIPLNPLWPDHSITIPVPVPIIPPLPTPCHWTRLGILHRSLTPDKLDRHRDLCG